jgi:gas vesicle protein
MTNSDLAKSKNILDSGVGIRSGLFYLLVGGGIGATLALLFAPKSGADLRTDITDLTRKGYDGTLELAGQLKEQSAGIYQTVKETTDKVYDLAATKLSLAQDKIEDTLETAVDKVNGELTKLDEQSGRSQGGGRRSASIM